MRMLVLGGTGFIGRMLVPQLQRAGQTVGVFHRGARSAELPAGVTVLTGNRHRLDQHWVADSSRIRAELGFVEPVPRPEAIRRTVEWERLHPPPVDPAQFDYAAEDAAI